MSVPISSLRKRLDSWLERISLLGSAGHSMVSLVQMTLVNWQKFARIIFFLTK